MRRIGFRYCGCCNPQLDLFAIEESVQQEVKGRGGSCVFVSPDEEPDLYILLNGCLVGCADAQHPTSAAVQRLVVQGWKANGQPDWIWEKGDPEPS